MIGGTPPHCREVFAGLRVAGVSIARSLCAKPPHFLPDVESAFEDVRAQERVGDAHDVLAAHAPAGDRLERPSGGLAVDRRAQRRVRPKLSMRSIAMPGRHSLREISRLRLCSDAVSGASFSWVFFVFRARCRSCLSVSHCDRVKHSCEKLNGGGCAQIYQEMLFKDAYKLHKWVACFEPDSGDF